MCVVGVDLRGCCAVLHYLKKYSIYLQKPSVIIVMSALFIFLALSLFGLFDLRYLHVCNVQVTH